MTRTPEGIDVQPLYRREDAAASKLTAAPGESSFLRGSRRPGGRGVALGGMHRAFGV